MTDETTVKAPSPLPTETIPAKHGEVSAIASATAPFLYFDGVPNFGVNNGIVNLTLEALRFQSVGGAIRTDRIIVAHVRCSSAAATSLRDSINGALQLIAAPKPEEVN